MMRKNRTTSSRGTGSEWINDVINEKMIRGEKWVNVESFIIKKEARWKVFKRIACGECH